ncbi:MAG: hypothetical protein Q6L50_00375 [Gloeomargarita sp. GMQP_bins_120]
MGLEWHHFCWEGERLVQVETQPDPLVGLLAEIREVRDGEDITWEDLYSAYRECPEDGPVTFYEAESGEAGRPSGVYPCAPGEETVITQTDIDTHRPVLALRGRAAQS